MSTAHKKRPDATSSSSAIEPEDTADLLSDSPVELDASELEDAASSSSHYEIVSIPADFTLEGLYGKWKKKQLEIPGFQRKFVWTQRQSSRLIESFLLGLPVPALFIYADPDTGAQQVIDGQQRLMSVIQFFDGQFQNAGMKKAKVFRLVGLDSKSPYVDCSFKDLEDRLPSACAKLNDAVMRAFVIKQLDPDDSTSIYHIFERLNTGGTRLLGQEIRNCVYHGPLNDLICSLNQNADWRKIIGTENPDARMRDVEMVLRFVALYYFAGHYRKPMKDFLSDSMRKKRTISTDDKKKLETIFARTCTTVVKAMGERPFHGRTGMNPAVFDAFFTAIADHSGPLPKDFAERCRTLKDDEGFRSQASYRTTDADAVNQRLRLAKSLLFGKK